MNTVKGLPPEVESGEKYLETFSKAISVQSVQSFSTQMIIRCLVVIVLFLLEEWRKIK